MNDTAGKTAILVLSDPDGGGEEALGRVFNALATAYELDQAGEAVRVQFQGAGTRWPAILALPTHPAHDLFEAVRHTVAGVSHACADLFGASESAVASGMDLIADNPVPNTPGLAGLRTLMRNGFAVLAY